MKRMRAKRSRLDALTVVSSQLHEQMSQSRGQLVEDAVEGSTKAPTNAPAFADSHNGGCCCGKSGTNCVARVRPYQCVIAWAEWADGFCGLGRLMVVLPAAACEPSRVGPR